MSLSTDIGALSLSLTHHIDINTGALVVPPERLKLLFNRLADFAGRAEALEGQRVAALMPPAGRA